MTVERHLVLQELTLLPSAEWQPRFENWIALRVGDGIGYWMTANDAVELRSGSMLVSSRNNKGMIRASSLGPLKLDYFFVQPSLLSGVLAMMDGQQLNLSSEQSAVQALIWSANDPLALRFSEVAANTNRSGLPLRIRLLEIWADAVAGMMRPVVENRGALDLRERFRQLLGQMSQAELSSCSLGDLAGQLRCSERHLSRLFREEFGTPFRTQQTELRLLRARQMLADSNTKIINVAYESGYRHLGLFNTMFKKRFGMTPTQWRQKAAKQSAKTIIALLCSVSMALQCATASDIETKVPRRAPVVFTGTPASPESMRRARAVLRLKMAELDARDRGVTNSAPSDAGPFFEVKRYEIRGNTLLNKDTIADIFAAAEGTNITFNTIRRTLGELQTAYRERGYATVAVSLPQQQLTNATVIVQVTEAPVTAVNVVNNHYYSSNNVMRALPCLRDVQIWTNVMLNSQVFQRELDLANANRDRQIYPILGPGADVGTSELTLKVKDRFPLHGRFELNNQNTPGTPPMRMNLNAQYGNLWDREHQIGVQYSFTPEQLKESSLHNNSLFDEPLVANYSGYYRIPLGDVASVQEQIDAKPTDFGYNEATHQFRLPPASGRPELNIYASRSTSDTGVQFQPARTVAQTPLITIVSQDSGEDVTLNEGLGSALTVPLPQVSGISSTLSLGFDFKRFRLASFNTNNFYITTVITNASGSQTIEDTVSSGQPPRHKTVDYVPLNAGLSFSIPDSSGQTFFSLNVAFNPLPLLSDNRDFSQASYSTNAQANYFKLNASASRELKVYQDWTVLLRADGQWADGPLISNEQFALGGLGGVRGYLDGAAYGDSGWRMQIEPRTPMVNIGMVDGDVPFWLRGFVFMDFGEVFLAEGGSAGKFRGMGFGVNTTIGNHLDGRVTFGWPMMDSSTARAGDLHIYFGLGAQF